MGTGSKCQRSTNVHKMPVLNTQDGGAHGETGSYCKGRADRAGLCRSEKESGAQNLGGGEAWPEEEAGLREGLQEEVGGARPWEQRVGG